MRVKNVIVVAGLLFAAYTSGASSTQPQASQASKPIVGKIVARDDQGISVTTVGEKPETVKLDVDASTKVLLNGAAGSLKGIAIGDAVVAQSVQRGGRRVATSVETHRHRTGRIASQIEISPAPAQAATYPYCPNVGSGGSIPSNKTPCYCKACGGAGSGMVW